jgi:hypothetical protein
VVAAAASSAVNKVCGPAADSEEVLAAAVHGACVPGQVTARRPVPTRGPEVVLAGRVAACPIRAGC